MKKIIIILPILFALIFSIIGAYILTKPVFGEKIAVIPLHGTISLSQDSGFFAEDRTTPKKFIEQLKMAEEDSGVKAIVVEINSPGGSVVASEEIASYIKQCKKPIVAWLGEIATSGAYFVASSTDYIVADRASITGSIGVVSVFPEYSKLLEKIGVNITIIKGGEFKDFSSGYRPMTKEEKEMMEEVVLEVYRQFLEEVAQNRNLSYDYVEEISKGKIYTGAKAKELGLVDEIGGKEVAIKIASHIGGIKGEPKVVTFKKTRFLEELIGKASAGMGYGFAKGLGEMLRNYYNK